MVNTENYDAFTGICYCEGIINSHLLTYITDNNEGFRATIPATEIGMPQLEFLDQKKMSNSYHYRITNRNDLNWKI